MWAAQVIRAGHEVKFRELVCCVGVHRQGINLPLLSKTVIVDAAVQARTISSVTGCERFPRQPVEGAVSAVDYLVG